MAHRPSHLKRRSSSDVSIPEAEYEHQHQPLSFHTTRSSFQALLAFPAQIWFAILGCIGLARYPRQVVRVLPRNPGRLGLRGEGQLHDGQGVTLNEWVESNVPSLRGVFVPTWWLPNGHLQTMFSVVGNFSKVDQVEYIRTYLRVPDGGTIGLDITPPHHASLPADIPTIVACHGLTGGSHESYVRNVLSWAVKPKEEGGLGVRAVVVNFRGCAGTPLTSPQFYSAGTILDLSISLHYLRHHFPTSPLHGIGFSLGASVISNYLGSVGSSSLLSSGVALGTPWDLPAMSVKLENHWFITRVYSSAMAQNLLRVAFSHYDKNPQLFESDGAASAPYMKELKRLRVKRGTVKLKDVDELMVSKFGGPQNVGLWPFAGGAGEYYEWASPKHTIGGVKVPLLAINAFDDPIIDGSALPIAEWESSSHIYGAISGGGGHLGWFEGSRAQRRWSLKPVSEWFRAVIRDFEQVGGQIVVEKDKDGDGWQWVVEGGHEVLGVGKRGVGWRVVSEGEAIHGAEGEGVMQGL